MIGLSALAALPAGAASSSWSDPVSLLWPQPREVRPATELQVRLPIRVEASAELAGPAALMRREVDTLFGPQAATGKRGTVIRLALAPGDLTRPEEYTVAAWRGEVSLEAHDAQGAFWAVHTLAVLLGQARRTPEGYLVTIPGIRDWPDTTFRAFMIEGAWVHSLEDYRQTLKLLARQHITYVAMEFGPQVVLNFDPTMAQGQRFTKAQAREVVEYAVEPGDQTDGLPELAGAR